MYLRATAKINLALDVVRRREDGYHDVRMIMQTVRLFDRINMKIIPGNDIRISTNLPYLPDNKDNLVYKSIEIIRSHYGIKDGIEAVIEKHIPVAAGLAGGSSDAAAVLEIIQGIYLSQLEGRRVELPLKMRHHPLEMNQQEQQP